MPCAAKATCLWTPRLLLSAMRSLYIRIFLAIGTAILICMIAALLISFTALTSAVEQSRPSRPRSLRAVAA